MCAYVRMTCAHASVCVCVVQPLITFIQLLKAERIATKDRIDKNERIRKKEKKMNSEKTIRFEEGREGNKISFFLTKRDQKRS